MFSTLSTVTPSKPPTEPPERPRRTRNRPGEGDRLRADIIDAADGLLADAGAVERLSLRGVARAVGITAPAIYAHFATKELLVTAVVERRFAGLAATLTAAVPDDSAAQSGTLDGTRALVRARARAYVRFGLEHPGVYAVLFGPSADHLGVAFEGSPGQEVFALLLDPVALLGRPGGGDPFTMATDLWVALHGLVALRSTLSGFPWGDLDAHVDRVVNRLLAS